MIPFIPFQRYAQNFKGFEELFGRFVHDKGHGLVWEDISPPPEAMVRNRIIFLSIYFAIHIPKWSTFVE